MSEQINHLADQYYAYRSELPGAAWISELRDSALESFKQRGFPTVRDEAWRYTDVRPITKNYFSVSRASDSDHSAIQSFEEFMLKDFSGFTIKVLNGLVLEIPEELVQMEGVMIQSLSDCMQHSPEILEPFLKSAKADNLDGFAELNRAFLENGLLISLDEEVELEQPLEILNLSSGDQIAILPRFLVNMNRGAKAKIVERYVSAGDDQTFTNGVSEISLSQDSELDYYVVQTSGDKASQVGYINADLDEGSRFSCRTITLGGRIVRNNLQVKLAGEQAHCDMLGLYNLSGRQHVDNYTTMVHAAANCTSKELYKGVLDNRSRGVFHGRIKVEQDAQKTDAEQSNNTLILSRDAEIDTKPQLEIYADDVKCSHGATIGQIDNNSLFYLRSRGIEEQEARSLLTYAFVNEVLESVDIAPLHQTLEQALMQQLVNPEVISEELSSESES